MKFISSLLSCNAELSEKYLILWLLNTTPFMTDYQLIEKEKVISLAFPKSDVISDESSRKTRSLKIHRATSLGNIESTKVYILFKDKLGLKSVFTTIWAQTREKIILKKGIHIPVNRIVDIRFS